MIWELFVRPGVLDFSIEIWSRTIHIINKIGSSDLVSITCLCSCRVCVQLSLAFFRNIILFSFLHRVKYKKNLLVIRWLYLGNSKKYNNSVRILQTGISLRNSIGKPHTNQNSNILKCYCSMLFYHRYCSLFLAKSLPRYLLKLEFIFLIQFTMWQLLLFWFSG